MPVLISLWDPPVSPTLLGMSDHLLWERAIYHLVSCNTLFIPGTAGHQGPSLAIDSTRAVGSCIKGNALPALSFQHGVVPNCQMTLLLGFKRIKLTFQVQRLAFQLYREELTDGVLSGRLQNLHSSILKSRAFWLFFCLFVLIPGNLCRGGSVVQNDVERDQVLHKTICSLSGKRG